MENLFNKRLRSDRRSRKSNYESRSNDSDKNSDLEETKSGGKRRERYRNRSTSETGSPFSNNHRYGIDSQYSSRSSSTSSTSSDLKRGRRESKGKNDKNRKRSNSPERNQGKGKIRTNSNDESYNSHRLKNVHSNITRKKTHNSRDRMCSSNHSHSRTRNCSDKRSSSRGMKHSSDRSLSRTRKRGDKRSNIRDGKHTSNRNFSGTRNRWEKSSNSRERKNSSDRSHSRIKNRRDKRSNSRDRKHSSDRSLSRIKNRRDKRSNSRDRKHSSDRNLSRIKNRRDKRSNSHGRKQNSDRSLSRIKKRIYEPNSIRERKHSSDRSLSKTRHHSVRRNHSYDRKRDNRISSSRESKRNTDDMRRYDMSPDSSRDRNKYKEDFYVRERRRSYVRGRNWSSSSSGHRERRRSCSREINCNSSRIGMDEKYFQRSSARFHTLRPNSSRRPRGKYMNSDTPTRPDDLTKIKLTHQHTRLDSTGSEEETFVANLLKSISLSQADPQNVRLKMTSRSLPIQFEWQFQDEHGVWISYGKPNSSGDSSATTTSSDDIETHYISHPTPPHLLVQSNQNNYLLDFQNMTQTNQTTSAQRHIRRISKQSPNIAPVNTGRSLIVGGIGSDNILHEWQFLDEHGSWITYGKPNSAGNVPHATTTCSDDIEKHYVKNQANPPTLTIKSKSDAQYVLDFVGMTQTNQSTSVQRSIRRTPKQSANIMPFNASRSFNLSGISNATVSHDWQFEDEHGSWVTYGKPNSAGNVPHTTTTSSDDIEKHYANNSINPAPLTIKSISNAQYILDFKKMTQTNQQTSVERKIRRVPRSSTGNIASPKGSSYIWSFKDEHGKWIKYGETNSSSGGTSDDIETKYLKNSAGSFEVFSGQNKYLLDFNAMNQTNIDTKTVRAIRRQLVAASDLPSHWKPMKTSDKGLLVVLLNKTDSEYAKQELFVRKTLNAKHTITKFYRIQNENLWNDYVYKKNSLKARYPKSQFKEEYLFHGTDSQHLNAICEENFDFRLNGTNGTLYGKGSYFARSADYSVQYSKGSPKVIFIVKVLVGRCTVGSGSDRRPPKDKSGEIYDTTVNSTSNPTIFVKYDNNEYYPEYYFEYT